MVYANTMLNDPYWTIPFTLHTDAYDKKLGAVIRQSNKILPSSQKIEQSTD